MRFVECGCRDPRRSADLVRGDSPRPRTSIAPGRQMRSSRTAAAWKECKMKRCILAVALGCLAGTALADVTYTYTGRPLQTGNPAVNLAPLTMVFDFASDGSALLDWSISQPDMGTIDPSNAYTLINKQITDSPAIYFYT